MKDKPLMVPGAEGEIPEQTLGVSHGREAAGAVADLPLGGGTVASTRVDLTTTEAVKTAAPGIAD